VPNNRTSHASRKEVERLVIDRMAKCSPTQHALFMELSNIFIKLTQGPAGNALKAQRAYRAKKREQGITAKEVTTKLKTLDQQVLEAERGKQNG